MAWGVAMFRDDPESPVGTTHGVVWPLPPGRECYTAWKSALSRLVDCDIPAGFDPETFDFHGCSWQLPEAFFQVNGGSAMSMSRSRTVIDERPISQMSIYLLLSGTAVTDYEGLERTLLPGDIAAIDYSQPFQTHTPGYEGITLTFDKVSAPAGLQGNIHGALLTADSSAGRYLGAQMRSLLDHIDGLTTVQAQSAIDGMLQFAATTLPMAVASSHAKRDVASILEAAHRLARARMSDPDFGPNDLAIALGVSRSKLFRSFEASGGVQRWLLGERLTASLQAMVRSAGKLKLSVIAHQHGFRSEAHFSRAFRKRYEMSPSSAQDLVTRSQGSLFYLAWAKTRGTTEGSTIEAWLASARARDAARRELPPASE